MYDYSPFDSPTELADIPEIELVVSGRVVGFAEGPIYSAASIDDPQAEAAVVMSVLVEEVFKGEPASSGTVHVVLERCDPLKAYSMALPAGTRVGLYLEAAPLEEDDVPVLHDDAGRPAGEPLWRSGPQALIVADGENDGVVLPLLRQIMPQADFEDQLPADGRNSSPTILTTSHGDPACAFGLDSDDKSDEDPPHTGNRSGSSDQNDPDERNSLPIEQDDTECRSIP